MKQIDAMTAYHCGDCGRRISAGPNVLAIDPCSCGALNWVGDDTDPDDRYPEGRPLRADLSGNAGRVLRMERENARLREERDTARSDARRQHLGAVLAAARARELAGVARMLLTGECPVCGGTVHHYLAGPVEYVCSARACGYTRTREQLLAEIGGE